MCVLAYVCASLDICVCVFVCVTIHLYLCACVISYVFIPICKYIHISLCTEIQVEIYLHYISIDIGLQYFYHIRYFNEYFIILYV